MTASDYPCARMECSQKAVMVYQGPKHPGIYGVCALHLSSALSVEYEGGKILHGREVIDAEYRKVDVSLMVADLEEVEKRSSGLRAGRDYAMRKAHAAGVPERELSRLTGLSRAQVQRICDLSARKDDRR